ncbi:MAG: sugar-binding protein [Woeseiaceae bacterium]|nr:sugar-binding protein [Woeseiaceae bacterium]
MFIRKRLMAALAAFVVSPVATAGEATHHPDRSRYLAPHAEAAPVIDGRGGEHHYNHNAFAYHMSLDNRAIDIGADRQARDYSHHVESRWRQHEDKLIWEVAIDIYTDEYVDSSDENTPVRLTAGKVMGLMVAYCDNDRSGLRENFVGSEITYEGKTDQSCIDAGLFGKLVLDD